MGSISPKPAAAKWGTLPALRQAPLGQNLGGDALSTVNASLGSLAAGDRQTIQKQSSRLFPTRQVPRIDGRRRERSEALFRNATGHKPLHSAQSRACRLRQR